MKQLLKLFQQFKEPGNGEVLLEEDQRYLTYIADYDGIEGEEELRFQRDEAEEQLLQEIEG